MLHKCVRIQRSLDYGLEITLGKLLYNNFMFQTKKLETSYNLVVGNDIESIYELIFAVLSIQVLMDLLHRVMLHYLEYRDIY